MPRMRAPTSTRTPWLGPRTGRDHRPRRLVKQVQQLVRNEAGLCGINMPVSLRALAMREEALRDDEMQIVLGARNKVDAWLEFYRKLNSNFNRTK
jgi:hypothetical protein